MAAPGVRIAPLRESKTPAAAFFRGDICGAADSGFLEASFTAWSQKLTQGHHDPKVLSSDNKKYTAVSNNAQSPT
jgi:hypothetical protein